MTHEGRSGTVGGFVELFNATNATNLIGYVGTPRAADFGQASPAPERRRVRLGFRVGF